MVHTRGIEAKVRGRAVKTAKKWPHRPQQQAQHKQGRRDLYATATYYTIDCSN